MSKSKASHAELIESLRDSHEAEEYLNAALEEDNPDLFLVALRNVAEAQGGVRRQNETQPRKPLQDAVGTWEP